MSRGLNKAVLIGNVGADPDVRTTASGNRIATFSLATNRRWRDRSKTNHEQTEWHRIIAWDRLAQTAERSVRKGMRLYLEGRLEYRSWRDPRGRSRYVTEIIVQKLIPLDEPGSAVETEPPYPEWFRA